MEKHRSVNDFLPKPEVKKELKDETNASSGTNTSLGSTGEDLSQQSGGSNTGGSNESIGAGTGVGGEQTNTNNDASGLGDVKIDVAPQNPAVGARGKSGNSSDKKGSKPTSK